jgi:ribose-phosphate pyrophosphokinase
VLVDDIASSGRTLVEAARAALAAGAVAVDAAVTHALLADDAQREMTAAGIGRLWSSDSVPHPSNVIAVAPLLAAALQGA